MKEKEKTSPYPILSHQGRKGQSGEGFQNPPKSPLIRGAGANSSLYQGRLGGISFLPSRGGGTFCEAKGGGAFGRGVRAFTLVELIIVITILAILATIAFISFQGYTSKSRDANRASTAKNIETGLSLFQTKAGVYPIQSTGATISLGLTGITVQGNLDLSIARVINLNEVPKDPKTGEPYNYISDKNGKGGKVLYYLENSPDYAFLTQGFADNETRIPIAKGQGPGVLLDTDLNMVTESVDLFGATGSVKIFTILVNDTTKVTGSGLELGGGFKNFAEKGGRLDAPKSCESGFIPVPGNAEFMQPGFCVAKYEMGYTDENTPNSCDTQYPNTCTTDVAYLNFNTVRYNSGKTIVSMSGLYPIANITQTQAIAECQRIGKHLITNNEWMTIARNIESNPVNWSGGVVGIGGIYRGITGENPETLGCQTSSSSGSGTRTYVSRALSTDTTKWGASKGADCDSKRQHKLSNGEVIWDLAGNVWEHVNGRNTMNTDNIGTMNANACGTSGTAGWNRYSFTNNATTDTVTQCDFINGYSYKRYGPKTSYMNASNGIGRIRSYNTNNTTVDRVFLRGGDASNSGYSGVFTLSLTWSSSSQYHVVGFRCSQ